MLGHDFFQIIFLSLKIKELVYGYDYSLMKTHLFFKKMFLHLPHSYISPGLDKWLPDISF